MNTRDAELSIDKDLAHDVRRVPTGCLDLTLHDRLGPHGHRAHVGHGDGARDVAGVEEAGLRDRDQRRRRQVVEQRGSSSAVQVAGFVAQLWRDDH